MFDMFMKQTTSHKVESINGSEGKYWVSKAMKKEASSSGTD